MKTNVIEIEVTGATQTGKSVILREIKNHLESLGLLTIYVDKEFRLNPPSSMDEAAAHERPKSRTIIALIESNIPRAGAGHE